jgi:hypothetical protein
MIEAGFVTFTEVTADGDHRAYNEWHQLDHLPEQFRIPGIAFGERWVLSPECAEQAVPVAEPLDDFHYVTLYLMRGPLSETLDQFAAVRERLTDLGRFYPHRRTALSGAWRFLSAAAAPRVLVAAEVVPYRPALGVYVVVEEPADGYDVYARRLHTDQVPALLDVPGVAGVWSFGTRLWGFAASGGAGADATRITVMFLDRPPLDVAGEVAELVRRGWEAGAVRPRFAGPLLAITPWRWDWFG